MKIKKITLSRMHIGSSEVVDYLFDAKSGYATVPLCIMNIEYRGFIVLMRPDEFLSLAATNLNKDTKFYEDLIEKKQPLGYPFLDVVEKEKNGKTYWKVRGHEGRHRCEAIRKLFGPTSLIPVCIIPKDYRNKDLTKEMYEYKFEMEDVNDVYKTFAPERYDLKFKTFHDSGKSKVEALTWKTDLVVPTGQCNLKKVQKNEDDVQEIVNEVQQPLRVYKNQSICPTGVRVSRRVN